MKNTFLLPFLLAPFMCFAENNVLSKANDDFNRSLVKFNERDAECRDAATILPEAAVSQLTEVSKEQLAIALKYYYFKALADCKSDATEEYLVSSSLLAYFSDDDRAEKLYKGGELIIDTSVQLLKAEVDFVKLDDVLKRNLEQIEALKKPFKLMESAKALGL